MKPLTRSVARFCDTLARLPEGGNLRVLPLHRTEAAKLHACAFSIRQHLLHFGDAVGELRRGSVTRTQDSLQHLQRAYRSLQGLMIGVPDHLLDRGEPWPQGTIRYLLQASLNFYHLHAPSPDPGVPQHPVQFALRAVPSPPPALNERAHVGADPLSALFERSERFHRSVVERLSGMPEEERPWEHQVDIEARLAHLETHLLEQHVELDQLLQSAGHRRTAPMRLAHEVFIALGHAEGAMIGAEARFESTCQAMIDLIAAHTNELGRYC